MTSRKEYVETLTLTKDELHDIRKAQFKIRQEGFENVNEESLRLGLSAFASILSFITTLPTAATLAASVIAAVTSSPSEREIIINLCRDGEDFLGSIEYLMEDHPEYKLAKVKLAFLEFVDEEFRIVTGGALIGIKTDNGWIV